MVVKPFRGAQVAAGAVVLTVLAGLLNARMTQWADGVHLGYSAGFAAFVLVLAFGSPVEEGGARPYQTALYVSTWALTAMTLVRLADVLGASGPGTVLWVSLVLTALAAVFAGPRASATGALLTGVGAAVAAIAFASWIANPSVQTIRWILFAVVVVAVLAALGQHERRPGHAVQLVNVGGLALLAIGATSVIDAFATGILRVGSDVTLGPAPELGWGWQLLLLAGGFGLLADASVDFVRGPAVLGVAVLAAYVVDADGDHTLLGWPLVLAIAGVAMLAVGLRPTTPLPPAPDEAGQEAEVSRLPPPSEIG